MSGYERSQGCEVNVERWRLSIGSGSGGSGVEDEDEELQERKERMRRNMDGAG